jgi:hypothetical protein
MQGRALLEFLGLVDYGRPGMHGLHAQDLVVALLVVEHGRGKIFKYILRGEWPIGLWRGKVSRARWG